MATALTLEELITRFRTDNDDGYLPYKWSDDDITRYLSEAQEVLCDKINLIPDELDVTYTSASTWVTRPEYITQVRDIFEGTETITLRDAAEWQRLQGSPSWRTDTGTVTDIIEDMKAGYWRLYPIPEEDGTLTASVYRRPLEELADCGELELTDSQQVEAVLLYARARSYLKQDADIFDGEQAQNLEIQFHVKVQDIDTAVERKQRRPGTVVYGGL